VSEHLIHKDMLEAAADPVETKAGIYVALLASAAISLKRIADALQPQGPATAPIAGHPRIDA
jgi:hypothetical protein